MARIKIRATSLPPGDGDGLTYYADKFIAEPKAMRLVLALLDTRAVTRDEDTSEDTATLRIRRIEVVADPDDARELQRIMMRANERRHGGTVLPLALEDDLEDAFAEFMRQGEAVDDEPDEPTPDEGPSA